MSDIAVQETKRRVGELAEKELSEIRRIAASRGKVADRIAQGGKVKKSSLLGEVSFGFASQRFSGGATTQRIIVIVLLMVLLIMSIPVCIRILANIT